MPRIIDRSGLPPAFPTHSQDASFWEALGRAVAAFGFLEWTFQRAIFALSGEPKSGVHRSNLELDPPGWVERHAAALEHAERALRKQW